MRLLDTTLGVLFSSGILLLAPSFVFAQDAASASTQRLVSEYQHLRAELDRVNAAVATLKRGERSVRTDYLLRDKMAEAEALARKVTAAEARLRAAGGPLPTMPLVDTLQTPSATPQDGAVELEAKADLLSDQARRFRAEAESLSHKAEQIRARQALRQRAGAWDRDPLLGFEASKRVAVIPTQGSRVPSADSNGGLSPTRGGSTPTGDSASKSGGSGTTAVAGPTLISDTSGPGAAAVPAPLPVGGGTTISLGTGPAPPPTIALPASTPTSAAAPSTSHPLTAPASLSGDSASKAAVQQRPLLDPATLASIRNSASQAGSLSDPDAVEAAATALRNHAQALDEQARRLRTRAAQ